jgi:four helix bundle protein
VSYGARGQDICDRTRAFALRIIKLYRALKKDEVGRVIGKQMLRCGTSIGANVEEAQAGQSRADFIHKMTIALKETRETKYWLTLSLDAELVPTQRLDSILQETDEIAKILYTIIKNAKTNKP